MNRDQLMAASKCAICHKGVGHTGVPIFWRVTVARYGVDVQAMRRQDALGVAMGSHELAALFGPTNEFAKRIDEPTTVSVCERCAIEPHPLAVLAQED